MRPKWPDSLGAQCRTLRCRAAISSRVSALHGQHEDLSVLSHATPVQLSVMARVRNRQATHLCLTSAHFNGRRRIAARAIRRGKGGEVASLYWAYSKVQ